MLVWKMIGLPGDFFLQIFSLAPRCHLFEPEPIRSELTVEDLRVEGLNLFQDLL